MKRKFSYKPIFGFASFVLASLLCVNTAQADGTEELGPPEGIDIAEGSGILVAGTGLFTNQPGQISIDIPAGVAVNQVLLYWSGRGGVPDDTILVDGMDVTGPLIGGPTVFPAPWTNDPPSYTYRADITASNWVVEGAVNTLEVSGLDFNQNDGAAVVVIWDDGSAADIEIRDGNDFAYRSFGMQTEPVVFEFEPSDEERMAYLWLIVSDIKDARPNAVDITVGGDTTSLTNSLFSNVGNYLDVREEEVSIPAGASNATVQVLSINDGSSLNPASLAWMFVSWSLPIPDDECGGGGLTPGFWQNKHGLGLIDQYDALGDLNDLCLVDDDGQYVEFGSLQEFRSWLKKRRAKNMAYQLSGHLAAMYMNVLVGSVNGSALVYIGDQGDMISINDLLDDAKAALCAEGKTLAGDDNRYDQEMLKNALDEANNNLNWVYPCICHY